VCWLFEIFPTRVVRKSISNDNSLMISDGHFKSKNNNTNAKVLFIVFIVDLFNGHFCYFRDAPMLMLIDSVDCITRSCQE